jgi:NAD(P)-dependent dehydrogenase (short-subunit alcohol dehydrogenase family)
MGRSHALTLADAGVNVVLCDRCADTDMTPYPLATDADMDETVAAVEARGRKALPVKCDVRDREALDQAVGSAMQRFGRVDVLVANAGVNIVTAVLGSAPEAWDEVVDINLTGVYNSVRAVAPVMVEQKWGRIVAVSSMLGRSSAPGQAAYVASKWGVIGLVKAAAQDLAAHGVTVNAVAPGNIATPMVLNDTLYRTVRPDLENPTADDAAVVLQALHLQPVPWLDPAEISAAVMFLVRAEHMTGSVIDVNAGASARFSA